MSEATDKHWLVRPRTIKIMWRVGLAILAVITVGDVAVGGYAGFGIDGSFAFYSWYGLATCVTMVLFSKILGAVLKRRDDYYDD